MTAEHILSGRTVVVTGGTGTFGSAATLRFLEAGAKEVRIFSRDEKKQDDLRRLWLEPRVRFFLGDVRDRDSLTEVVEQADVVFHAAALKQVPSCEFYPIEAVRTNVLGTDNVLWASRQSGVEQVVVLSTDKAAYPVNAMGMSKALMERVAGARARELSGRTTVCATRYGNVLASRGSVVPLFLDQIQKGVCLTVTDPEMTRFLMTIDDAIELVLFALERGNSGDLFVHKASAAKIGDLAEALLRLFPSHTAGVQVIGVRHGEKDHETLLTREEASRAEDLGYFYRVGADTRDLNYEQFFSEGEVRPSGLEEFNSYNAPRLSIEDLVPLLRSLPQVEAALEAQ